MLDQSEILRELYQQDYGSRRAAPGRSQAAGGLPVGLSSFNLTHALNAKSLHFQKSHPRQRGTGW